MGKRRRVYIVYRYDNPTDKEVYTSLLRISQRYSQLKQSYLYKLDFPTVYKDMIIEEAILNEPKNSTKNEGNSV